MVKINVNDINQREIFKNYDQRIKNLESEIQKASNQSGIFSKRNLAIGVFVLMLLFAGGDSKTASNASNVNMQENIAANKVARKEIETVKTSPTPSVSLEQEEVFDTVTPTTVTTTTVTTTIVTTTPRLTKIATPKPTRRYVPTPSPTPKPTKKYVSTPKPTQTSNSCYGFTCSYDAYNCPDFSGHAQAQKVYECCLRKVGYDVHRLDRDKDGLACE